VARLVSDISAGLRLAAAIHVVRVGCFDESLDNFNVGFRSFLFLLRWLSLSQYSQFCHVLHRSQTLRFPTSYSSNFPRFTWPILQFSSLPEPKQKEMLPIAFSTLKHLPGITTLSSLPSPPESFHFDYIFRFHSPRINQAH